MYINKPIILLLQIKFKISTILSIQFFLIIFFSLFYRINSAKKRTLSKDEFIERARLVHGDKYDYSKVDYKYSKEDVIIICKIHGDFLQRPGNHIRSGQGCPKCAGNINKGSQEFIEEVIKIHGNIYDYSKVDYKNANTKIIISCKIISKSETILTLGDGINDFAIPYLKSKIPQQSILPFVI